jgi:two-component system LytT family response regulator
MADPIRAVVVDDEPAARQAILTLLAEEPEVRVVGEAANGNEAVERIRALGPELVFLDVQMPDRDGFQVLEALGAEVPPGLVFVTAYDQHAIRAFEVHALDYVLKPFGRPRFHAAVSRALERLRAHQALQLQRTLEQVSETLRAGPGAVGALAAERPNPSERPARLAVRTGTRTVMVEIDAIDWIEACGDYLRVHAGSARHLISGSLANLEQWLDPRAFLRIHRSLLVSLARVRELHREADGGGAVVLADGVRLRVARGRWEALEAALRIADPSRPR